MGMVNRFKKIFGKTLYFPGCLMRTKHKDIDANYQELLKKADIQSTIIKGEICCGKPLLDLGKIEEFYELRNRNMDLLSKMNINKILTPSAECLYAFNKHYDIPSEHILKTLNDAKIKPNLMQITASYHDPCLLARGPIQLTEEPRELLKRSGVQVQNFKENREQSVCCGAGGSMRLVDEQGSMQVCERLIEKSSTDAIITSCINCFDLLNKCKTGKQDIIEMSQVLNNGNNQQT